MFKSAGLLNGSVLEYHYFQRKTSVVSFYYFCNRNNFQGRFRQTVEITFLQNLQEKSKRGFLFEESGIKKSDHL